MKSSWIELSVVFLYRNRTSGNPRWCDGQHPLVWICLTTSRRFPQRWCRTYRTVSYSWCNRCWVRGHKGRRRTALTLCRLPRRVTKLCSISGTSQVRPCTTPHTRLVSWTWASMVRPFWMSWFLTQLQPLIFTYSCFSCVSVSWILICSHYAVWQYSKLHL